MVADETFGAKLLEEAALRLRVGKAGEIERANVGFLSVGGKTENAFEVGI